MRSAMMNRDISRDEWIPQMEEWSPPKVPRTGPTIMDMVRFTVTEDRKDGLNQSEAQYDLSAFSRGRCWSTILADPPWRFRHRTGKSAPEHSRLLRYPTMSLEEIEELPVADMAADDAHLYLWVPNALLREGLAVMSAWGFRYKTNLVWFKTRRDGGPDGRGMGFYFRNVTEMVLFGVRGSMRTLSPGRRQVNLVSSVKRDHSRKPDEMYDVIESCSPGPRVELFARSTRAGWDSWGNEVQKVVDD